MNQKIITALKWIIDILNRNKVRYQITGGLAAHFYGANRKVNDIDLDIPENEFDKILPEIRKYITFGPAQYKDKKWDVKLITLNYRGQEIDLGGAFEAKLYDDIKKRWIPIPADFSKIKVMKVNDININVVDANDLIDYKRLLEGEHQTED